MATADNKQLMQHIFTDMAQGNFEPFLAHMAEDIRWTVIGTTKLSTVMQLKSPGVDAAEMAHLIVDPSQGSEDIPDGFALLCQGGTPVMVGHDTPQPCPNPLLGIQLRRVGGLGLEPEPPLSLPNDGVYGNPLMLFASVMNHQPPLAWIIGHQVLQESRKFPLPQDGADRIVGPSGQRGHGARDRHRGMGIRRGPLRPLIDHAPRGGQRGMAAHGRLIDHNQLPIRRPLDKPLLPCGPEGRLLLHLGLQLAVPPAAQAKAQLVQHPADPRPALLNAKVGSDTVADQCRRPPAHVITRLPGTAVDGMDPASHRVLVPRQPRRYLRTALAIYQQQHAVLPLAPPHMVRLTKAIHTCARVAVVFVIVNRLRPSLSLLLAPLDRRARKTGILLLDYCRVCGALSCRAPTSGQG
jgi:hypothetical protein